MSPLLATATHVERTDDPAVMRWVFHRDDLDTSADGRRLPPEGSPLGQMVDRGMLAGIEMRGGDLLVRASSADDWPVLANHVHQAVLAELTSEPTWLTEAPDTMTTPGLTDSPGTTSATGGTAAAGDTAVAAHTQGPPAVGCGSNSQVASAACAGCHVRSACGTSSRSPNRLRQLLNDRRN